MVVVLILNFGKSSALRLKQAKSILGAIPLKAVELEQGRICSHNLVKCLVQQPRTDAVHPQDSQIIHFN